MAFTEFCCKSGGSNLNAGTRTGSSTEPGTAADFTYASGSWVAATGVFTVASGNPSSDGVAVGDFASVYADGSTVTGFVGRVTARTTTTITVSLSAKAGTAPVDGTGTRTLKIGGAWQGPNGAVKFPFEFVSGALVSATGVYPRVNFKNAAAYDITAGLTHNLIGPQTFQGYTTTYGDLGKATFDGGTVGASYVLLTVGGSAVANTYWIDLIFQNNGATGSAGGIDGMSDLTRTRVIRCVVNNIRGSGTTAGYFIECEFYACNKANVGAVATGFGNSVYLRCIAHDNVGAGFYGQGLGSIYIDCISESNGSHGFYFFGTTGNTILGCEAYNNGGSGVHSASSTTCFMMANCNFFKNAGYGIEIGSGIGFGVADKCGFGSGAQANTLGDTFATSSMLFTNTVNYPSGATPWVAPVTGDFRITHALAKGAGRGTFTQTAAGYGGTIAYPDIGAAQHQDMSVKPTYGIGV